MSNKDTTAHDEASDSGPIVEPRKIRGTHLVGITAIIAVVVVVGTYLLGRQTASTETRSAEDEQVLQAAVVAEAVEFGDFLLEERQAYIDERSDEDASDGEKEERAHAENNIGYDDVLEDAAEDFADDSDLAVEIHEIKDDNSLPVHESEDADGDQGERKDDPSDDERATAEDESGDEVDDNGFVQVEVGFTSACINLVVLEQDGPSKDVDDGAEISWVTAGPCPNTSAYSDTTTTTSDDTATSTTTSTTTEDGS